MEQILQHGAMGLPEMEGCHGLGIIEAAPAGKDLPLGEDGPAEEAAVLSIPQGDTPYQLLLGGRP